MESTVVYLVSILVLIVGSLIVGSFYFYTLAIKRSVKDFLSNNEDLQPARGNPPSNPESTPEEMTGREWLETQNLETWQIASQDGLRLVGYYLPAQTDTTKTVILAHGYTSQGKDMASFARFYHDKLGYNVLMPDARGHGQSEGNYIGFGWPDRKDYLIWIAKCIERVGEEAQIALHGISMGAATVMMVSGEDLPEQVKAIVEDCGYTSVYDQLAYQLKRMYKLPPVPIVSIGSKCQLDP